MNLTNLTKQEQGNAIGTLIPLLGQDIVNESIDKNKLESAIPVFDAMEDNTIPKQRRETLISLLDKTIDEFIKNKE
ncbi:hypothetical protein COL64_14740 [Bacillus toyonensis]|uniref:hypothetical protein n=1 Tax=Bacillus toyonensis TaxID=155322 RepID=UPI000BEFD469|nr:hypothetical protein [Bacillus toyonensis]PEK41951.1 hypothetical protein CN588_26805 [Bacillus toyonensis]PFZ36676.1 hypothetical protein COL64_14740 [Bacillus toyonensis]